jgi:hypothetical protein
MKNQSGGISKLLNMAIKRYQYDVVGWTKFCIDKNNTKQKALPPAKSKSLEILRIQDKISTSLNAPSIQKIFNSKSDYINWLDKEYTRDKAFYETILKNPSKYNLDSIDGLLDEEIDNSARNYLSTLNGRKGDEESLIMDISDKEWDEIRVSKYPKVLLGLILGASEQEIINNFGIYFINLLKAHFAGSRTAFLTSSGPASWQQIEQCKTELEYFKKVVVHPLLITAKRTR